MSVYYLCTRLQPILSELNYKPMKKSYSKWVVNLPSISNFQIICKNRIC